MHRDIGTLMLLFGDCLFRLHISHRMAVAAAVAAIVLGETVKQRNNCVYAPVCIHWCELSTVSIQCETFFHFSQFFNK